MAQNDYILLKKNANDTWDEKYLNPQAGQVLAFDENLDPTSIKVLGDFDCTVGASGANFTTLGAAIASGNKKIKVIGNTTETANITLTNSLEYVIEGTGKFQNTIAFGDYQIVVGTNNTFNLKNLGFSIAFTTNKELFSTNIVLDNSIIDNCNFTQTTNFGYLSYSYFIGSTNNCDLSLKNASYGIKLYNNCNLISTNSGVPRIYTLIMTNCNLSGTWDLISPLSSSNNYGTAAGNYYISWQSIGSTGGNASAVNCNLPSMGVGTSYRNIGITNCKFSNITYYDNGTEYTFTSCEFINDCELKGGDFIGCRFYGNVTMGGYWGDSNYIRLMDCKIGLPGSNKILTMGGFYGALTSLEIINCKYNVLAYSNGSGYAPQFKNSTFINNKVW